MVMSRNPVNLICKTELLIFDYFTKLLWGSNESRALKMFKEPESDQSIKLALLFPFLWTKLKH